MFEICIGFAPQSIESFAILAFWDFSSHLQATAADADSLGISRARFSSGISGIG